MLKKKIFFILSIFLLINFESYSDGNVHIIYRIDNDIITNVDVQKERRYLISLNTELKSLDNNRLLEISKESSLREKIKKIELSKYFDLELIDPNTDKYLKNYYKTLNIESDIEFKQYLDNNDLTIGYFKGKIQIELLWNQLVYERYKNQINIDEIKLQNQ